MGELKKVDLVLKWIKLPSVNKIYVRTRSGMTLSPEVRLFKKEISLQVRKQLPKDLPFERNDEFKLTLNFVLRDRFFQRDVDNMLKMLIDSIFEELGFNDSKVLEINCTKSLDKTCVDEMIVVRVQKSYFDYKQLLFPNGEY